MKVNLEMYFEWFNQVRCFSVEMHVRTCTLPVIIIAYFDCVIVILNLPNLHTCDSASCTDSFPVRLNTTHNRTPSPPYFLPTLTCRHIRKGMPGLASEWIFYRIKGRFGVNTDPQVFEKSRRYSPMLSESRGFSFFFVAVAPLELRAPVHVVMCSYFFIQHRVISRENLWIWSCFLCNTESFSERTRAYGYVLLYFYATPSHLAILNLHRATHTRTHTPS